MAQEQVDKAALLVFGETPAEVCRRLEQECQAFAEQVKPHEQNWNQMQVGREWSPAQEVEHVMRTNHVVGRGILLLLSDKELKPMPKLEGQRKNGKRQAPKEVMPSAEGLSWAAYQAEWPNSIQVLQEIAAQVRKTPSRTMWHPFLGELDAFEWLQMVTWHIGHHRNLMQVSLTGGSL